MSAWISIFHHKETVMSTILPSQGQPTRKKTSRSLAIFSSSQNGSNIPQPSPILQDGYYCVMKKKPFILGSYLWPKRVSGDSCLGIDDYSDPTISSDVNGLQKPDRHGRRSNENDCRPEPYQTHRQHETTKGWV